MAACPRFRTEGLKAGGQGFYQEEIPRWVSSLLPSLPSLQKRDCPGRNGIRGSLALLFFQVIKIKTKNKIQKEIEDEKSTFYSIFICSNFFNAEQGLFIKGVENEKTNYNFGHNIISNWVSAF